MKRISVVVWTVAIVTVVLAACGSGDLKSTSSSSPDPASNVTSSSRLPTSDTRAGGPTNTTNATVSPSSGTRPTLDSTTTISTSPGASITGPPRTGSTSASTVGSGVGSSRSAYYTVSGRVTHRQTGQPYKKAYVRFGWLVNADYEAEAHVTTNDNGRYTIQLPPGQYQVTAGDSCDLNADFAIVGSAQADGMITVPGTSVVDFVGYPITPGANIPGLC